MTGPRNKNNWTLTVSNGLQPAFNGFCQQQLDLKMTAKTGCWFKGTKDKLELEVKGYRINNKTWVNAK